MATPLSLVLKMKADTSEFSSGFSGALNVLSGFENAVTKTFANVESSIGKAAIAAGAIGVGVAGAAAAAGIALYNLGSDFDKAYDKIQATTGASGARMQELRGMFKSVLSDVPDSMDAVATAVGGLAAATDLTGKPLHDVAVQLLDLTRLTGTDVKQNVTDLARVFGDWSIRTEDQSVALDKMYAMATKSGIGINQLAETVVFFGAPLRQLGFTFDESISLLAKWQKEGVNVETVLGGLRRSMSVLADPTDMVIGKLQEFPGLFERFMQAPDIASRFQVIRDEINALLATGKPEDKLAAISLALTIFQRRAGPDVVAAFAEGRFAIDDYLKTLDKAPGSIERARKGVEDFGEKWDRFVNNMKVSLEPWASDFFDQVNKFMETVVGTAEKPNWNTIKNRWEPISGPTWYQQFQDWYDKDGKDALQKVEGFLNGIAAALNGVNIAGQGIGSAFNWLATVGGMKPDFMSIGSDLADSLSAAYYQRILPIFQAIQWFFTEGIPTAATNFANFWTWMWENTFTNLPSLLYNWVLKPVFDGIIWFFTVGIPNALSWLGGVFSNVWNAMGWAAAVVWSTVLQPIVNALSDAAGWLGNIWQWLRDIFSQVWEGIKTAFEIGVNAVRTVLAPFVGPLAKVVDVIKDLPGVGLVVGAVGALAEFVNPFAAGGCLGCGAQSGFVTNGPQAIVGEGNPLYPEYVIPTDPKYRGNALALFQALGGQLMATGGTIPALVGLSNVNLDSHYGIIPEGTYKKVMDSFATWAQGFWAQPGASTGAVPPGGCAEWIAAGIAAAGFPASASEIACALKVAMRESGCDPNAINLWDSNAARGDPSRGLMQTIGGTFNAYGGGDIYNPVDNVRAATRYAYSRYGNWCIVASRPGGYAAGGIIADTGTVLQPGWNLRYNGTGHAEALVPTRSGIVFNTTVRVEGNAYSGVEERIAEVLSEHDREIVIALERAKEA